MILPADLSTRLGRRTIVFGGPSLSHVPKEYLHAFERRGPARRGDMETLMAEPSGTVLLLDGLFGGSMAVTPLECRQLIGKGWRLVGASSIGALRASELWNAGMLGVGRIYQLLRLGVIESDADVAVAYHPDSWDELTVSMVHVCALAHCLERRTALELPAASLISSARAIYWLERSWSSIWSVWQRLGMSSPTLSMARRLSKNPELHPKKRDALEAVALLSDEVWLPATEFK